MTRGVLWDSGAVLALLDASDANHALACAIATGLSEGGYRAVMTNYVEAETHALLLRRLGRGVALSWLLTTTIPVSRALLADEQSAKEILARYDDKDFSLCDAISFVVMRRLGIRTAFSFDRHFLQYGRFEVLGVE